MKNRRRPIMQQPKPRALILGLCLALFAFVIISAYLYTTKTPVPDETSPVELLGNQTRDDLKQAHNYAMDSAKESILLVIYALNDKKLISTLNRKSTEGVSVEVICDRKASARIHKKLNPNIIIHKPNIKGLMHLKILVTDRQQVWIGSANLTGDSMRIHGNLVAGLHSPPLAQYVTEYAATLVDQTAKPVPKHHAFVIGGQPVEMWFLPKNQEALPRLKELVRSAQKTVRVAMYTWTRRDMANTVANAYKRGVDVQVIIDGHSSRGASREVVEILKKQGVPVSVSTGSGLLHHKLMIIDNKILVNGSTNWTKAAFTRNDDCFMIFEKLTRQQQEKLKHLWEVIVHESEPAENRPDRIR